MTHRLLRFALAVTALGSLIFIVNAATSGIMAKAPYTARPGFTQAQIIDAFGHRAFQTTLMVRDPLE